MSKTSFGLGKGLSALIPSKKHLTSERMVQEPTTNIIASQSAAISADPSPTSPYRLLPIDHIVPNPRQPRTHFEPEELEALAESLKRHGLLQPIVVTMRDNGTAELVSGERRLRAAKQAGFREIPAIVRTAKDLEKLELALIENIHRQDLNPIERAQAYQVLISEFSLTQEGAGERIGVARSVIANTLRYLELLPNAQEALIAGKITEGHAKILASLSTTEEQQKVLETILSQHYTVRETETVVKAHRRRSRSATSSEIPSATLMGSQEQRIVEHLRHAFGTKIELRHQGSGGAILVYYYSSEELMSLVERMTGGPLE